jgi:hypothetical protein
MMAENLSYGALIDKESAGCRAIRFDIWDLVASVSIENSKIGGKKTAGGKFPTRQLSSLSRDLRFTTTWVTKTKSYREKEKLKKYYTLNISPRSPTSSIGIKLI